MKHIITSLAAVLAAATLVATGGPAHAEKAVVDDPFRDVWQAPSYDVDADWQEAGRRANVDMDRSVIRHRARTVVATIRFTNLRKRGEHRNVAGWMLRTDAGRRFLIGVEYLPGTWSGYFSLLDLDPLLDEGDPEGSAELPVCDAHHEIDFHRDRLTIRLPRSCIGDPVWVKGSSWAESFASDDSGVWRDAGHHRGHELLMRWTKRLTFG